MSAGAEPRRIELAAGYADESAAEGLAALAPASGDRRGWMPRLAEDLKTELGVLRASAAELLDLDRAAEPR